MYKIINGNHGHQKTLSFERFGHFWGFWGPTHQCVYINGHVINKIENGQNRPNVTFYGCHGCQFIFFTLLSYDIEWT